MTTTAIHDCCEAGALAGLMNNRGYTAVTASAYANLVATAKAVADQFITVNAASGAPIADADKVNMPQIVQSVAQGAVNDRQPAGSTPTEADINQMASVIYAVAAEAKATGGLT